MRPAPDRDVPVALLLRHRNQLPSHSWRKTGSSVFTEATDGSRFTSFQPRAEAAGPYMVRKSLDYAPLCLGV